MTHDVERAARYLILYCSAGGRPPPGGAARRNAEAEDLKVSDQSLMCDLARSRSDLPTVCSISRDLPLPQELYAAARAAV